MKSNRTRGTALILAMVMMVMVTGMVACMAILAQNTSVRTQVELDTDTALVTADIGIQQALMQVRLDDVQTVDGEMVGFVDKNLDETGGDTSTLTGSANGFDYTVQIRSAYLAHQGDNADNYEAGYLPSIVASDRNDVSTGTFDVYEITSACTPVGQHELVYGNQMIVRLRKVTLEQMIRSPLYIANDESVDLKGAMTISGLDHWMDSQTEDENAKTNNGKGNSSQTGGAGAEDDYLREDGRDVKALGYGGSSEDATGEDADEDGYVDELANINMQGTEDQVYSAGDDGTTISGLDAAEFLQMDLRQLAAMIVGGTADNITPTKANVVDYGSDWGSAGNPNDLGSDEAFQITYIKDDVTLAGQAEGAGILVIDGDLHISGQMTFNGIVIVLGEVNITGGSNWDTHVFGSVLADEIGKMTGNADVWWSSEAVDRALSEVEPKVIIESEPVVYRSMDRLALQTRNFPGIGGAEEEDD